PGDTPKEVNLEIYRVNKDFRQLVRTLVHEGCAPGDHEESWDGLDDSGNPQPSGEGYRCRVVIGDYVKSFDFRLFRPEKQNP
ncbi:hypothetical protein LLH00_08955, partial [bacterium]|nr:hypothetical protein [bacterium]